MGLSIKIKDVKAARNMELLLEFENGVFKKYDVRQLIKEFPIYRDLEKYGIFGLVRKDCGGYGVSWNEDIDISECELWENGITISK